MSAKLGTLTLDLVAKVGTFTSDMKRAENQVTSSNKKMSDSFNMTAIAATAVGGILTGLTVDALANHISNTVKAADAVKKFADLTNSSTKDFQLYAAGAETVGVSLEQFAMAGKDALDRLGEAKRGEGEMMDFFEKIGPQIGVTIEQFKDLSGPEVLQKYFNGLQQANLSHAETITYMEQIVNDGSLLIPLLKDGGAGFKYWGEEAQKAGAIMSDEMIASMIESKDNLALLDLQWKGFQNNVVNTTIPIMRALASNTDVIGVAVGALTSMYAVKMIPTIYATGSAFVASSAQAVLYQATLARMSAQAAGTTASLVVLRGVASALGAFMLSPVGLAIAAVGVASAYVLMRNRTVEATAKLAEQALVAEKTKNELLALQGVERQSAVSDLTATIENQNKSLRENELAVGSALIAIQNRYSYERKIVDISNQARLGTLSYTDALEQLNGMNISPELYNALKKQVGAYEENRTLAQKTMDALRVFGIEVELSGNKAQNAASQIRGNSTELNENERAARGAADAQTEYQRTLANRAYYAEYKRNLIEQHGFTENLANEYAKLQEEAGGVGARISKDAKDQANQTIDREDALKRAIEARNKAIAEGKKNQSDAAKKAAADAKQSILDAKNLRKQQESMRDSLKYMFSSDSDKMLLDYKNMIKDINDANFSPADREQYVKAAIARTLEGKKLYDMQMTYELNEHKWNEEQKLRESYNVKVREIQANFSLDDDAKTAFMKMEKEKLDLSLENLKFANDQRLFQATSSLMSETQIMQKRYQLERDEIIKNYDLDKMLQDQLIAASIAREAKEKFDRYSSASSNWGGIAANMTGQSQSLSLLQDRDSNVEASGALFDAQIELANTAEEREAIWQAHNDRMLLIEENYYQAKAALGLTSATETLGTMTDLFGSLLGEQSTAYKAMFALEKGFAVAKALMAVPESYSQAYNAVVGIPYVGPYLAPVMGVTAAAAQMAQVAMIQNVNLTGMAHSGIDNIPSEGTWLLDKGERVLSPRQNADLTQYLNQRQQQSGINIEINNNSSAEVSAYQNSDGSVTIDVVERVANKAVRDAFGRMGSNPNSYEAKQTQRGFNVRVNRGP